MVASLAEAFSEAAEHEPDPEQKGRLQAFGRWLAGTGQGIAAQVISTVIKAHTGGAA